MKFLSINETYNKAARRPESKKAVFGLSEILVNAVYVKEKDAKKKDKNQRAFDKMIFLKYGDVNLIVGNQASSGQLVQYCITVADVKNKGKKKSRQ